MALATFNLAAVPLKYVALPVVVGFAAGTGALAAYVATPAPAAKEPVAIVAALPAASASPTSATTTEQTPAKSNKKPSCEEQTWPYIDNRCIARKSDGVVRTVRFVMAPREGDSGVSTGAGPKLVTSDGVLRGPGVAPEIDTPKAKPTAPTVKQAMRRSAARQQQGDYRRVYSVYSVPSAESSTKPVIVVRPLRVNQYSSRF